MKPKIKIRRKNPDIIEITYPRRSVITGDIIEVTHECPAWLAPLVIARAKAKLSAGLLPFTVNPVLN